jgi:hypothetical protein
MIQWWDFSIAEAVYQLGFFIPVSSYGYPMFIKKRQFAISRGYQLLSI